MKLLIKNGLLVDGSRIDIALVDGIIAELGLDLDFDYDQELVLADNTFVSAGWIDIHTHGYKHFELYADDPDEMGYKQGVTTVVDAGTCGADVIGEFAADAAQAHTRVLALLNVAHQGIVSQDELADLDNIDFDLIRCALANYPEFIIGLKARMSASVVGDQGINPLFKAMAIAQEFGLPMMVHIGTQPPSLNQVLNLMRKDDIVTHIFNGKDNGIYNTVSGGLLPELSAARQRGVYFDIGHGRESFSFDVAKKAMDDGFLCDTISSDIYSRNRLEGPVYSLACTMNKMLYVGYSLERVIQSVTTKAAEVMHLSDRGHLECGLLGDLTFFRLETINETLIDSTGKSVVLEEGLVPVGVVLRGEYYEIKSNH